MASSISYHSVHGAMLFLYYDLALSIVLARSAVIMPDHGCNDHALLCLC
jgi:hypothetical protein